MNTFLYIDRIPYFDAWVSACLRKEDTVLRLARDEQAGNPNSVRRCKKQIYFQGVLLGLVIIGIVNASDKEEEEEDQELPRWRKCPDKMHKYGGR